MIALDLSVLACAANRYAPEHARAVAVVEDLAGGELPWALPWPVLHEFVRLVTHPHAVVRPLEPRAAGGFVESLLESPSARLIGPTSAHARALTELLEDAGPGGLPSGFETAVVLREHGIRELLSADRGMRRFHFLTVIDPLHGEGWTPGGRPARRYRVLRSRGSR